MAAVGGARALDTLCAVGEKGPGNSACRRLLIAVQHRVSEGVGGDSTVQDPLRFSDSVEPLVGFTGPRFRALFVSCPVMNLAWRETLVVRPFPIPCRCLWRQNLASFFFVSLSL